MSLLGFRIVFIQAGVLSIRRCLSEGVAFVESIDVTKVGAKVTAGSVGFLDESLWEGFAVGFAGGFGGRLVDGCNLLE